MTTEANKEIVRRWFDEVIGQRQIDLIDEICAPEVVNWAAVPERRYGIEGMKDIRCPTRGWRHVIISDHHGKQDFAQVIRWLLDEQFSGVEHLR
jgi:hypothetical protein